MKKLLTIGEFAKLHHISIKSLYYYEKIGLLTPAYINPSTNYRYYDISQVDTLNFIQSALEMNIPLKETEQYLSPSNTPDFSQLFLRGKKQIEEEITNLSSSIKRINRILTFINDCNTYANRLKPYIRHIPLRYVIYSEQEINVFEQDYLFDYIYFLQDLKKHGIHPIFPSGVLHFHLNEKNSTCFFSEILEEDKDHPLVCTLPAGNYLCFQQKYWGEKPLPNTFRKQLDSSKDSIVIDSFMLFYDNEQQKKICETQILL